jgi:DNA repair exonuclease SbcCD ATPase subunit
MTTDTPRTDAAIIGLGYRFTEDDNKVREYVRAELARELERELAEMTILAGHNITTKAEIDRVWGAQTRELRAELAEARAKELTLKEFVKLGVDEADQLRAEVNTLREIAHEENCPHQYYTEGGIIYGVHGTSSITYVEELRKEREQLRAQLKELQTHKSGLVQDVNNLERGLRDANEDKAIVDWLEQHMVGTGYHGIVLMTVLLPVSPSDDYEKPTLRDSVRTAMREKS